MQKEKGKTELNIDEEFKSLIPPLTESEFNTLKESIINEGCRDPLVIWDDIIIDGHNRYNICMSEGIIFKKVEKNFDNRDDAKIWILENQLGRRNLNDAQRIDVVDKLFGLKERQEAKKRQGTRTDIRANLPECSKGRVRDKLGKKAKVSGRTYEKGKIIKEKNKELWEQCLDNKISIDAAFKELNKQQKEQDRQEQSKQGENIQIDIDLRLGDFVEVLKDIPDNSIDLILTDPPYPIEHIKCWKKLAEFAKQKLKPNGFCIAYCGHKNLFESMKYMNECLDYYWIFALIHNGNTQLIKFNNIAAGWKPLLVYQNGYKKIKEKVEDVINGTGRDKQNHDWEQSEDELKYLIEKFTKEGDTILDPFAGSGTTLIATKKLNRKPIGAEIEKDVYNLAKKRINDEL